MRPHTRTVEYRISERQLFIYWADSKLPIRQESALASLLEKAIGCPRVESPTLHNVLNKGAIYLKAEGWSYTFDPHQAEHRFHFYTNP